MSKCRLINVDLYAKLYIECIGTEFGTLQIRRHIRSVDISGVSR